MPLPLHPEMMRMVSQLLAYSLHEGLGVRLVPVTGGGRTTAEQAAIRARSRVEGFRAAPAGKSCHEVGAAADFECQHGFDSPEWAKFVVAVHSFPELRIPFPGDDPGHVQASALCQRLRAERDAGRPLPRDGEVTGSPTVAPSVSGALGPQSKRGRSC